MSWRTIILFLAITFLWSWGFWAVPLALSRGEAAPPSLVPWIASGALAAWGPFVGALCVALVQGGRARLWALLKRGVALRFGWRWYLVVFLIFPVLIGGSMLLAGLLGESVTPSEAMQNPVIIPVAFVIILFTGGPLQEEFGWRGTLLDPLQDRFGALGASLAVGAIWAVWHLPLFLFPNDIGPYYGRPFWGTLVTLMLISVLFTWVWNNTGRSLAAVMILHAMFNLSHWVLPVLGNDRAALILFAAQFIVVAAVVWRFSPRRLSRAGPA